MAKKEKKEEKKPVVVLDDKEYEIENMADDQKVMLAHIQDLQRKIDGATRSTFSNYNMVVKPL